MTETKLQELERRIERMEAVNEILNLMAWYENLHTAYKKHVPTKDDQFLELWAKRAPNTFLYMGDDGVFEGYEGIRTHTKMREEDFEQDMTGRFNQHDITTPLIEVADDAQTAKALFFSPGVETHTHPVTGKPYPCWCFGRYRADFIKEDGVWKFWRVKFHCTFSTPYNGGGWTEIQDGFQYMYEGVECNPVKMDEPQPALIQPDRDDFDVLRGIPRPFEPYETWTDDMFNPDEF